MNSKELKSIVKTIKKEIMSIFLVVSNKTTQLKFVTQKNNISFDIGKTDLPIKNYILSSDVVDAILSLDNKSNISFTMQDEKLYFKDDDIYSKIEYQNVENVDNMFKPKEWTLTLNNKEFNKVLSLSKSFRYTGTYENWEKLKGVYLKHESNKIEFAAMDGYKMYIKYFDEFTTSKDNIDVILPKSLVNILEKINSKSQIEISKHSDESFSYVSIKIDDITINSYLSKEDEFFHYDNMLARYSEREVNEIWTKSDRMKYLQLLDKIKIDKSRNVQILTIKSNAGDEEWEINQGATKALFENKCNKDMTIAFNGLYFKDILKVFKNDDDVKVTYGNELEPMIAYSSKIKVFLLPLKIQNK